jgi:hypothetical protein
MFPKILLLKGYTIAVRVIQGSIVQVASYDERDEGRGVRGEGID